MSTGEVLAGRIRALTGVVDAAEGRADDDAVSAARSVVERAGARVAFSGGHTVVAMAGATGSGKSSLVNAISGTALAKVAVRRPTTSKAMAVGWGSELPHDLLDWLEVGARHLIPSAGQEFFDLILLDLPDHDSTEVSHKLAVDRLVGLVDALIWVVDPQKYADSALHDGYLARLTPYAGVMMVVLNQVDRLTGDEVEQCRTDLRRLLDAEGLSATPILVSSAQFGVGVSELREAIAATVAGKQAMVRRLSADVSVAAAALRTDLGTAPVPSLDAKLEARVVAAFGVAAGVPVVVESIGRAWRRDGRIATGWPFATWFARLSPAPLGGLRLRTKSGSERLTQVNRSSLPKATSLQKAQVDQGLRELVDVATDGLPRGWQQAVWQAAKNREARLLDRLDVAIATTDLGVSSGAWWWGVFRFVQSALIIAVLGGAVWLLAEPWMRGAGLPSGSPGLSAGLWLLVGAVLAGVLLGLLGHALVRVSAKKHAEHAQRSLEEAVRSVVVQEVFEPVRAELERYREARELVSLAAGI